uniref:hypothetical protein n=1 Tax=Terriglobus albidus TaxID=1592106 RepID=UPI0037D9AB5D
MNRFLRLCCCVVDECCIPANHGQIGGVVGDLRSQDLSDFAFGKLTAVAAYDLGDPWTML